MINCMECYPRMCRCERSKEEQIGALILAIASGLWSEEEKVRFREELLEMLPFDQAVEEMNKAIADEEEFGPMDRARLQEQVEKL